MRPEWSDRAFTRGDSCTAEDGLRSQYVPSTIERRLSHLVRRNAGLERGEHTREVLSEAGCSEEEIAAILAAARP